MLVFFTDFGASGPYPGQMRLAAHRTAPGIEIVDLLHDAPSRNPRAAAYLLAALLADVPDGAVVVAVVDPGVGTERAAILVETGRHRLVGPDNGLLAIAAGRAASPTCRDIAWRPRHLSATFHGRDLFTPVAARIDSGAEVPTHPLSTANIIGADWPDDLAEIIYIDPFGNAMTGLRAGGLGAQTILTIKGQPCAQARTFADMPQGAPFWFENSNGLAEIALNGGDAANRLGLAIGDGVGID